ncbi:MAG: DUF1684 domain-containing protein [Bacteroidota bacterium]
MRCFLVVVTLCFLGWSCKQKKRYHDQKQGTVLNTSVQIEAILQFQKEKVAEFKNPETSPLPDRYRKNFQGLDFFPPEEEYIINAYLKRTPEAKPFKMATSTDRESYEVVYGIATFQLNGVDHELEVYRGLDMITTPGFENRLFLPFLDLTNGEETYGGGRYLDLRIPDGDTLVIDFNRAYNPYCVYNKKYSCPLVPRQNFMNTRVLAGEKQFSVK